MGKNAQGTNNAGGGGGQEKRGKSVGARTKKNVKQSRESNVGAESQDVKTVHETIEEAK